jgi:hypothetical protein
MVLCGALKMKGFVGKGLRAFFGEEVGVFVD